MYIQQHENIYYECYEFRPCVVDHPARATYTNIKKIIDNYNSLTFLWSVDFKYLPDKLFSGSSCL